MTQDIDELKMNTAIAAMMTMVNELYANGCSKGDLEMLCLLLSPFAPHMVEEMWENMGFAAKTARWPCRCPGPPMTRPRPWIPTWRWPCRSTAS